MNQHVIDYYKHNLFREGYSIMVQVWKALLLNELGCPLTTYEKVRMSEARHPERDSPTSRAMKWRS